MDAALADLEGRKAEIEAAIATIRKLQAAGDSNQKTSRRSVRYFGTLEMLKQEAKRRDIWQDILAEASSRRQAHRTGKGVSHMAVYMTAGMYVWTLTPENGAAYTVVGSTLDSVIGGGSNVISATRGPAVTGDAEAPVPAVTSLVPATVTIGEPSFTVHVHGTGFGPGSVIVWNGFDEPTTVVSPTEVTTGVNMPLWTAPATVPVLVRTGAGASNSLPFTFVAA
jgi:hypothetical protein